MAKDPWEDLDFGIPLFDKDGNQITPRRFSELFSDKSYQICQQTDLGAVLVSSIWLGTDMSFGEQGPPLIFEVMVFLRDERREGELGEDLGCWRFATEAEALVKHHELVGKYTALLDIDTAIVRLTEKETDT